MLSKIWKYILILLALLVITSCGENDKVTIRLIIKPFPQDKEFKTYEIELPQSTTELALNTGALSRVEKIEGIEKLKNLEKLAIALGGSYSNFSFIKDLHKLDTLIVFNSKIDDFDFLKDLKKLEVLSLSGSNFYSNEINLLANKKLNFLDLTGTAYRKKIQGVDTPAPFVPNLSNIPESLDYLNISNSPYIIISKDFLNTISKISYIILGKKGYIDLFKKDKDFTVVYNSYVENMSFLESHSNFIFTDTNEVLPKKYSKNVLFGWRPENDIWAKMKEVGAVSRD